MPIRRVNAGSCITQINQHRHNRHVFHQRRKRVRPHLRQPESDNRAIRQHHRCLRRPKPRAITQTRATAETECDVQRARECEHGQTIGSLKAYLCQQIQRLRQRKQRRLNAAPQPQKCHAVHQIMRTHIHSIIAIFYPFWRGYGVELLRQ